MSELFIVMLRALSLPKMERRPSSVGSVIGGVACSALEMGDSGGGRLECVSGGGEDMFVEAGELILKLACAVVRFCGMLMLGMVPTKPAACGDDGDGGTVCG